MALPVLGPFQLLLPVGRGGAGVVWKARHTTTQALGAVKVLNSNTPWTDRARREVAREVRATAGLDHPNIVRVFDQGEVDEASARQSDGQLQPGAPWLAMELADGGTLALSRGALTFRDIRRTLRELLLALSYAHSRGYLHRDIKPGNVLFIGNRPVLADFGLAVHTDDPEAPRSVRSGTPQFMAPEQFDGRWRDFGPWTDLYALGVMTWLLATGTRPHGRHSGYDEYGLAHRRGVLAPWQPRVQAPPGFQEWVQTLIARSHRDRFRSAADALAALHALTTDQGEPSAIPPVREEWRRPERGTDVGTVATGLGLFGLRALPLIGRDPQCAALWKALLAVRRDGRPVVVQIEGPAGCGKSRLAAWLVERAHELGQAVPMRALHGPEGGASHGLPGLLARLLGCTGMGVVDAVERLSERVPFEPAERAALARMIADEAGEMHAAERHGLMTRVLQNEVREAGRPAIVWIDDGQWADDALAWAERCMDAAAPIPALIVITVQTEAVVAGAPSSDRMARLLEQEGATTVHMPPLPPEERRQLVKALLPLHDTLAVEVERRSAGNPLFAVQLVGACVQDNLLEVVDGAFALRPGAALELPADLAGIWSARIERVLASRPAEDRTALAIAALLGLDVDDQEWAETCQRVGVRASPDLADALVSQRLATRDPHLRGWSFAHGMLADAVRLDATHRVDIRRLHQACADTLEGRRGRDRSERLGRHRLGAGQDLLAIDAIAAAAEERATRGEPREALALLDLREAAILRVALPESDRRHGVGWSARARVARVAVNLGLAGDWLDRAEVGARKHGWNRVLLDVLIEHLMRAFTTYDIERITALRTEIEQLAPPLDAWQDVAEVRRLEAWARLRRRDPEGAHATALLAVEAAERAGSASQISRAECVLSELANQRGDIDESIHRAQVALRVAREANEREAAVQALNQLGALYAHTDPPAAITLYEEALELAGSLGYIDPSLLQLNLGTAWSAAGNQGRALGYVENARDGFKKGGRKALLGHTWVVLARLYAQRLDLRSLIEAVDEAVRLLEETRFVDPETCQEAAAAHEASAWDLDVHARLGELVRSQKAALGLP